MVVSDGYQTVNGVRLHYLAAGSSGPAVVLSHGNSHCAGVWLPLLEALAARGYTAVSWDLPGHGWSDKPDSGYEWSSLRDDLLGLVAALGLTNVLFAGHSRGGGVSLLAAAASGNNARGALVYEPTLPVQIGADGRPAPVDAGRTSEMAARAERRRDSFPSREALAAYYRSRDGFRAWRQDYFDAFIAYGTELREDGTAAPCVPPRAAARLFEQTFQFEAWGSVQASDLPVHVVFGDRGGRTGPGRDPEAILRALFPRVESSIMADSTHTGPMEHPEEFEALIHAFAARL